MNNLGIFTLEGREHIADWVMHGSGRVYQRHEIQARIVRLLGILAREVETLISELERTEGDAPPTPDNSHPAPAPGIMLGDESAGVEKHSL